MTYLRTLAFPAGIAVAAALPLFANKTLQQVLVNAGVFALLALGLNVVVGQAGLLDLGYVAFYAIGAYTAAILLDAAPVDVMPGTPPIWAVFLIAMVVSMLAGVILGTPVLRLRGDYLAIVTLGFGEIVRIWANNADSVTNGARGVNDIPILFGSPDPLPRYYLLLGIIVVMVLLLRLIDDSPIGRAWIAIREDESAAEAMGVNTLRMKLMAFAIGAGTASFAGVIQATRAGSITPASYTVFVSILILSAVVLGGMGSKIGVLVGAVIIFGLPETEFLRRFEDYRFVVFGGLLVAMMVFRPQGLIPSTRRAREMKHASSEDAATAIPTEVEAAAAESES